MKFGPRCGCCCVEECNMPFVILRFCSAGFLLVLCGFFAFIASFLLVLFKFSASFLPVLFFRSFLQVCCRCSALCLVCSALGEYQSLMQEAVPGVIEYPSKWGRKGNNLLHKSWKMWPGALQSTKNGTKLAQGGGKGYQQINQNVNKKTSIRKRKHNNENKTFSF